jgi:hypothetical protein
VYPNRSQICKRIAHTSDSEEVESPDCAKEGDSLNSEEKEGSMLNLPSANAKNSEKNVNLELISASEYSFFAKRLRSKSVKIHEKGELLAKLKRYKLDFSELIPNHREAYPNSQNKSMNSLWKARISICQKVGGESIELMGGSSFFSKGEDNFFMAHIEDRKR